MIKHEVYVLLLLEEQINNITATYQQNHLLASDNMQEKN